MVRRFLKYSIVVITSKYTLGAFVAAILAALGAYVFTLPRPIVYVDAITISTQVPDYLITGRSASVPSQLLKLEKQSVWISRLRKPSASLDELYQNIKDSKLILDEVIRNKEAFLQVRDDMMKILEGPLTPTHVKDFFEIWETNDSFMYGSLKGDFNRRVFEIPGNYADGVDVIPPDNFLNKEPLYIKLAIVEGLQEPVCLVSYTGSYYTSFLIPELRYYDHLDDYDLNKFACYALAAMDKPALISIINSITRDANSVSSDTQLLAYVRDFEDAIGFLEVTMTFSNDGRDPITFSPYADLLIETKSVGGLSDPVAINLEHRNVDGVIAPINLSGGESYSATFYSEMTIGDTVNNTKKFAQILSDGDKSASLKISARPILQIDYRPPFLRFESKAVSTKLLFSERPN